MSLHEDILSGAKKYYEKINKIIDPVKSFFGINCIVYIEVTNDNNLINLTNNYSWLEHCIYNKYYMHDPQMVSPNNIGTGHIMWSTNWESHYDDEGYNNSLFADAAFFGIEKGLTWIDKNQMGYKVYIFSSDSKNEKIHPKLYSNISLIKHFINYFDEEIKPIRQEYFLSRKIDLVELKGEKYYSQRGMIIQEYNQHLQKYLFLKEINLLDSDLLNIKLTNREIQCIKLYLNGNAAQDTAKILSISRRTVETHMNNIKSKLKINYKKDLFKRFMFLKDLEII